MSSRALAFVFALGVAGTLASAPANAQQGQPEVPDHGREYLRGLPAVSLQITASPDSDASLKSAILTDVELRLRQARIKIVPGFPAALAIFWGIGPRDGDTYTYLVDLSVEQRVRAIATGRVWRLKTYTTGMQFTKATAARCEEQTPYCADLIRATIRDRIDAFINDWQKVNPSKQP